MLFSQVSQGWRTITQPKGSSRGGAAEAYRKHPLISLITRAKAECSESKWRALERWQRGEADFGGLLLLAEEWRSTTVQQDLQDTEVRRRGNPMRLRKMHRDLQKRIYDLVRKWFPNP